MAEARAASRCQEDDAPEAEGDEAESSALDTEVESLKQKVETLVGDVSASKQQLESTHQLYEDFRKTVASASNAASGTVSNKGNDNEEEKVGALRRTVEGLEFELDAALQENVVLSRQCKITEEKLSRTEAELENAIVELTQSRSREQGRSLLLAGQKRERDNERDWADEDEDEESTGSEDQSVDRSSAGSFSSQDEQHGSRSEDDEDSEVDEEASAEPEVIVLDDDDDDDEEEPSPKKQKPDSGDD